MRALVACEESQVVCKAFRAKGHEAYSCDIQECSGGKPEWHIKGNAIEEAYSGKYDLMIAHPPCTYLTVTGNKWMKHEFRERFPNRERQRKDAVEFFMKIANCPIPKYCIENPVGIMSTLWRKPNQIVQPMYLGHNEPKKTCLWLRSLPRLNGNTEYALDPSICEGEYHETKSGKRMPKWYAYAKGDRSKVRSKTFQGIADAMANQWG